MAQSQTPISNNTLDLVELRQMRGIQSLVPENAINREELLRRPNVSGVLVEQDAKQIRARIIYIMGFIEIIYNILWN